ncbi:MAG TPA: hypothetical protein VKP30_12690 [Polyangiaceae bacterium]|nr:hypothetical protein [Polyangiaceae bacterium]
MTSEAGQAPQAASAHGFGGKSTGRRVRSARPDGWGQHHYFEERNDEAAAERIGACSKGFRLIGALARGELASCRNTAVASVSGDDVNQGSAALPGRCLAHSAYSST